MGHTHNGQECTNASVVTGVQLKVLSSLIEAAGFYIVSIAPDVSEKERLAMFNFRQELVDSAVKHGLTTFQVAEAAMGLLSGSLEEAEIVDKGEGKSDETLN